MQVKFRTIHYSTGTYLVVEDSDGADVSFRIKDDESLSECLERNASEQQYKARVAKANADRMLKWLQHYQSEVLSD